mgnify:CR=1 FL=1
MTTPSLPEYAPLPPKASRWEDCLDIFYNPREVYERRRDGKFWIALVVYAVLVGVLAYLGRQAFDAISDVAFREAMAGQQMTEEQAAQAKAFGEKFRAIGPFIGAAASVLLGLIVGTVFWVLARLLGASLTVAQGITIWVFAAYPTLVNTASVVVQSFLIDPATVTTKHAYALSAARFLPAGTNGLVLKLASLADPFVIWSGILVGIGAYTIGKMEKERAAVLAVLATTLYVLAFS